MPDPVQLASVSVVLLVNLVGLFMVSWTLHTAWKCRLTLLSPTHSLSKPIRRRRNRTTRNSSSSMRTGSLIQSPMFHHTCLKPQFTPAEWTSGLTLIAICSTLSVLLSGMIVCLLNIYYASHLGLTWSQIEQRRLRSQVLISVFISIGFSWQTMTLSQFERLRLTFQHTRYAVGSWTLPCVYGVLTMNVILGAVMATVMTLNNNNNNNDTKKKNDSTNSLRWWVSVIITMVSVDYIIVNVVLIHAFFSRTMKIAQRFTDKRRNGSMNSKMELSSRTRASSAVSTNDDRNCSQNNHNNHRFHTIDELGILSETGTPKELCSPTLPSERLACKNTGSISDTTNAAVIANADTDADADAADAVAVTVDSDSDIGNGNSTPLTLFSFPKPSPPAPVDSTPPRVSRSIGLGRPSLKHDSSNQSTSVRSRGGSLSSSSLCSSSLSSNHQNREDLIDASIRVSLCVILSILTTMAMVLLESLDPLVSVLRYVWIPVRTATFTGDLSLNAFCLLCCFSSARKYYSMVFGKIHSRLRILLLKFNH